MLSVHPLFLWDMTLSPISNPVTLALNCGPVPMIVGIINPQPAASFLILVHLKGKKERYKWHCFINLACSPLFPYVWKS